MIDRGFAMRASPSPFDCADFLARPLAGEVSGQEYIFNHYRLATGRAPQSVKRESLGLRSKRLVYFRVSAPKLF
jgi:hypothetical protein